MSLHDERSLSSSFTFFYKFVFPTAWLGGFGGGTIGMFVHGWPNMSGEEIPFAMMSVVGGLFLYWVCGRLKKITMSGDTLSISNYFRTVEVSITDVERVWATRLLSPEHIGLEFSNRKPFGKSVIFMPPTRFTLGVTEHPLARELRTLIASAKSKREAHDSADSNGPSGISKLAIEP
jgi:hypothetical protein